MNPGDEELARAFVGLVNAHQRFNPCPKDTLWGCTLCGWHAEMRVHATRHLNTHREWRSGWASPLEVAREIRDNPAGVLDRMFGKNAWRSLAQRTLARAQREGTNYLLPVSARTKKVKR